MFSFRQSASSLPDISFIANGSNWGWVGGPRGLREATSLPQCGATYRHSQIREVTKGSLDWPRAGKPTRLPWSWETGATKVCHSAG